MYVTLKDTLNRENDTFDVKYICVPVTILTVLFNRLYVFSPILEVSIYA